MIIPHRLLQERKSSWSQYPKVASGDVLSWLKIFPASGNKILGHVHIELYPMEIPLQHKNKIILFFYDVFSFFLEASKHKKE